MNDLYFRQLTDALQHAGIARPTLLVDKQRLDRNIDHLLSAIQPHYQYRIVAKSLPSVAMLRYIMNRAGTHRLMSFHLPFVMHVIQQIPEADILLGKPMPVSAVRCFYDWQAHNVSDFHPDQQLQWLVDSLERLQQYRDYAEQQQQHLQINLEINVGLNRGGFNQDNTFRQALQQIKQSPWLTLSGLMGYEAHVSKIPAFLGGAEKAFRIAMQRYQHCVDQAEDVFGREAVGNMCLNAGGSSTYPLYQGKLPVNEIATASALVKPTDFDVFTLEHHDPAAFIAAPVLKDVSNPDIPMAGWLSAILRKLGLSAPRGVFIYGGNWLAQPCYPADSKRSDILGHSSNQELYEVPPGHPLKIDDFMFFRPTQSEAVLLQFGDIALLDGDHISEYWPVFQYPSQEVVVADSPATTSH